MYVSTMCTTCLVDSMEMARFVCLHMYVRTYIYMYVDIRTCICNTYTTMLHVHVHVRTYIRTCIYTYTCTICLVNCMYMQMTYNVLCVCTTCLHVQKKFALVQGDGGSPQLPSDQRPTDQGCVSTAEKGKGIWCTYMYKGLAFTV